MQNLNFRMIGVISAAVVFLASIFIAPKTVAQSTISAFSGVCAGIFNVANPYEWLCVKLVEVLIQRD